MVCCWRSLVLRAPAPLLLVGGVGWWPLLIGGLWPGGTPAAQLHLLPASLLLVSTVKG